MFLRKKRIKKTLTLEFGSAMMKVFKDRCVVHEQDRRKCII